MSDFLALDWESHQISGVEASTNRNAVTVRKAFVLKFPDTFDPEKDGELAADWLKKQLAGLGVGTRNVLLSLPRESIVVRRLTVPNAPDEELPALVQMQAATKSSTPLDQLELDFLPLSSVSHDGGREVLMCTMARKKSAKLRTILEKAGLELESLGISSVATAELIAREEQSRKLNAADTSLIVARHGQRVEISILQQHQVIFTHFTQIHADDEHSWGNESAIVAEVQRSMMSLHPQTGQLKVDRAWLIGEEQEVAELAAAIQKRLKCETTAFNPKLANGLTDQAGHWPEPVAGFAGPAGMLFARTEPVVAAIDFQNPRKQRPRRDIKKIRLIAAAAALAVLFIAGMGFRWWKVQDLQNEILAKRGRIDQLKKIVKAGEPTMKSAGLVGDWELRAGKELAQIGPLYSALPGTDLMYLVKYHRTSGSLNALSAIQAEVRAKSQTDARELYAKLAEQGIKVKPPKYQESSDSEYPVQFTLDLERPLPVAKKPASPTAPKP